MSAHVALLAALREHLLRSLTTDTARVEFNAMKKRCDVFDAYFTPSELISSANFRIDRDERDRLIGALIVGAHRAHTQSVSHALLWLTLWNELSGLFRWYRRRVRADASTVLSELSLRFHERIARTQPAPGQRVVANLLLSTRRDLLLAQRREGRIEYLFTDDDSFARVGMNACIDWKFWLDSLSALDREIVLRVVLLDEEQQHIAASIGCTHNNVRKRYERARQRLAEELVAA